AAQLIVAWSHHGRVRSEAAFARLAGVAPDPRLKRPDTTAPTQPRRRPPTQPRPPHDDIGATRAQVNGITRGVGADPEAETPSALDFGSRRGRSYVPRALDGTVQSERQGRFDCGRGARLGCSFPHGGRECARP